MSLQKKTTSVQVGDTTLYFETGQIARQANGAVVLKAGETVVFATACAKDQASPDQDFFPLRVDYQEKFSSAGKTLGGFIKREGRPTERETLVCRLIDRPLRPMFPEGYFNEVQVLSYVLSFDGDHSPEPLAICCASCALVISDIPLVKPIGAVRVGYIDGEFVVNPSPKKQEKSKLDLILAGTEDAILMIEGFCDFLTEDQVLEAIEVGHKSIKDICRMMSAWQKELGKEKNIGDLRVVPEELSAGVKDLVHDELKKALLIKEKKLREEAVKVQKKLAMESLLSETNTELLIRQAFDKLQSGLMRSEILENNLRPDGRKTTEIRDITIEQHPLPRTHGSSLFTRGETQALAVCTLGGQNMAQKYETLFEDGARKFYLQYSFPPYSVGEVGRQGPPGRREVGHGKLAERAILPTIPSEESFPYTIRLESNITESNGSSSMASVCGGCLALMEAGVPLKRPVSGIAMGLILEGKKFSVLSDILGIEDYLGDMDFKVTGDADGITAFQMDIKVEGISLEVMRQALSQAKDGRVHILNKMLQACPQSKVEMSNYAPRIVTVRVKPSKIGTIIGPSGKMIRYIVEETGVEIDIDDSGLVSIVSPDKDGVDKALQIIKDLTAEVEVGKVYHDAKVTSIKDFGAFVELLPGKEGLCHISEFDNSRIDNMRDVVKEGDKIDVKVLEINDRGQFKLSRRATLTNSSK